jgi:cytoskeleton protein RodZ
MTETLESTNASLGSSAGMMLREARERQGMHIAMLAAMMKVTPSKLEALEADRYDELPDLAFARALAKTVCRALKVDPVPVLAKLPSLTKPERLEHTAVGLNTPFREGGGGRHHDSQRWAFLRRPVFWATLLVLAGAALMAVAPPSWLQKLTGPRPAASANGTVSTPLAKPAAVMTEVAPAPPAPTNTVAQPVVPAPVVPAAPVVRPDFVGPPRRDVPGVTVEIVHAAPPGAGTAAVTGASLLVIRAKAEAWVDVSDARGRSLLARALQAGETVGIDGETPLRVRSSNAPQLEVRFRGELIDLASRSSGGSARVELK